MGLQMVQLAVSEGLCRAALALGRLSLPELSCYAGYESPHLHCPTSLILIATSGRSCNVLIELYKLRSLKAGEGRRFPN